MILEFASNAPEKKNFIKKVGRVAQRILPIAQRILPVAATFVPALAPVAAIANAIKN